MDELSTKDLYILWLEQIACANNIQKMTMYSKLFEKLYDTTFDYSISRDENREQDGIDLRYKFGYNNDIPNEVVASSLDRKPCSVLEMMVALAMSEEDVSHSDIHDDNTADRWFWDMIESLELDDQTNNNYSESKVDRVLQRFLNRQYRFNGRGGLFTLMNPPRDLRTVEIWYQACWYLDEVLD